MQSKQAWQLVCGLVCLVGAASLPQTASAWSYGTTNHVWYAGGRMYSSPAIGTNGVIYVGSTNGCLYAFNPNGTTQHVWSTGDKIYASPAIGSDGTIYVGNDDAKFYAFNPDGTTQHVWAVGGRIVNIAAIARDGTIYVGSEDNIIHAFNPDGTTQRAWNVNSDNSLVASPVITSNGCICIGNTDSNLYLFNSDGTTQMVWHNTAGFNASAAISQNGIIYIGDNAGAFHALLPDGSTQHVWHAKSGDFYSSAAIGPNGMIYVGDTGSNFYAFRPNGTTQYVWNINSRQEIYSSPAIASNGVIYVGCDDGRLYAFNPDGTTNTIWELSSGRIQGSPAIGLDGTVYIGDYDSTRFFALPGVGGRLADTPWPKFGQNMAHTGRALAPATNVSASTLTFDEKVRVTWDADPQATGHRVWRGTSMVFAAAAPLGTAAAGFYNDLTGQSLVTYYYWVVSTNAVFTAPRSPLASGARGVRAPLGVDATKGVFTNQVMVRWTASPDAASYEVWRSVINNTNTAALLGASAVTNYADTNAAIGTVYFYWVKSKLGPVISRFSASSAGYLQTPTATLVAPGGVQASDGVYSDKTRVTWDSVTAATSYEVWRGSTTNPADAALLTEITTTTFDDASGAADTVYYYGVRARNASTTSAYSTMDSGYRYTASATLDAPGGVSASDGDYSDRVLVQWTAVADATSYEIWRHTANNSDLASQCGETANANYDDTNAAPDTVYYYWLKARNAGGASSFSASDSGYRTSATADIDAPAQVQASDGSYTDRVAVAWSAVAVAQGYQVWRAWSNDTAAAELLGLTGAINYDDLTVEPGIRYYYWVKATNADGTSAFSSPDVGWSALGASASGAADLALSDLVFLPGVIGQGAAPSTVSVQLANLGPDAMAFPNTRVSFDFYLSANDVWGDGDDRWIGEYASDVTLADSASATVSFSAAALAGITIPREYEGEYYVFLRGSHSSPSTLNDAVTDNNVVLRAGTIIVGEEGETSAPPGDYDGDGISDLTLYQESSGVWMFLLSQTWQVSQVSFGYPGYEALRADFNGDGRYDLAVRQRATGMWFVRFMGQTNLVQFPLGAPTALPVPADYDHDGLGDPAVYDPQTGMWQGLLSARGYQPVAAVFGGAEFLPAPGDYDGDGKADPSVYSAAAGRWEAMLSGSGYRAVGVALGGAGFEPMPGDFDGDGRIDPALYRAGDGVVYVMLSSSGYGLTVVNTGLIGCIPVTGDFDGDGKYDAAFYLASAARWTVMASASGFAPLGVTMGGAGFAPVR